MDAEFIKTTVEVAKPLIETIFKTFVAPKIEELKKKLKNTQYENIIANNTIEIKFSDYLERTYKKCLIINTIVFSNQQISIEELYYPLTIKSTKKDKPKTYLINSFKPDIFLHYEKILISDSAGMGKSTLMKWLCLSTIKEKQGIPILIELRKLSDKHSILDEIYDQFNPIDNSLDKDLILKFLELGQFIIFLDGYDEIGIDIQEKVTRDLKDFINKTNKNFFILTSRPESSLSAFGDFQDFHIQPLEIKESYELIKKYDYIGQTNINDKLINDIETTKEQIKDFLKNPFLVSLLYRTYLYHKEIPSKKITFYNDLYDALYKTHDSSKDAYKRNKLSNLDIYNFRQVLQQLAYNTAREGKIEYTEQELLLYLKKTKENCGIEFKENNFCEDLLLTVPLFVRDGNNIKWAHKSIQDYFAAEFIKSHIKKEDILKKIYESQQEKYLNILDLFYELDYLTYRKIIIYSLAKDFVNYCDTSYQNCQHIKKTNIRKRQEKTFFIKNCGMAQIPKKLHGKTNTGTIIAELFPKLSWNFATTTLGSTPSIIVYEYLNFKILIVGFLAKYNSLITQNLLQERFRKSRYKKPTLLDENPDSTLNKLRNFNITTQLMGMRSTNPNFSSAYTLDYDKCIKLLSEMEQENNSQDNILDGI